MPKWFGTFDFLSPHRNCYVEIDAPDYTEAHTIMRAKFGNAWKSLVDEEAWARVNWQGHTSAQRPGLQKMELPE